MIRAAERDGASGNGTALPARTGRTWDATADSGFTRILWSVSEDMAGARPLLLALRGGKRFLPAACLTPGRKKWKKVSRVRGWVGRGCQGDCRRKTARKAAWRCGADNA